MIIEGSPVVNAVRVPPGLRVEGHQTLERLGASGGRRGPAGVCTSLTLFLRSVKVALLENHDITFWTAVRVGHPAGWLRRGPGAASQGQSLSP